MSYVFELDVADSFDSVALETREVDHTGTGEVAWALEDDEVELATNTAWFGRVRAVDGDGVGSQWSTIEFFVRGGNDAPPVPELISPEDEEGVATRKPVFVAGLVVDPEGDLVGYQFRVSPDVGAQYVLFESGIIDAGGGPRGSDDATSWQVPEDLAGEMFWTARAVDEHGAASDWAAPRLVTIGVGPGGGCSQCSAAGESSPVPVHPTLLLLFPAVVLLRRRR